MEGDPSLTLYARVTEPGGVHYEPVAEKSPGQQARWFCDDGGYFRMTIIPPDRRPIVALGLDSANNRPLWLLLRLSDGRFRLIRVDGEDLSGPVLLRFSFYRSGCGGEHTVDVALDRPDASFALPPEMYDADGIVLGLLKPVKEGAFDLVAPYPPVKGLWSGDQRGMRNERTGLPIRGRQDFPDILEPDGIAVAAALGKLVAYNRVLARGEARPMILSTGYRFRVESTLTEVLHRLEADETVV
jgi:hypothetical protein